MKYSELHNLIRKNGWVFSYAKGSHYFYTRNEKLSPPIPFHGSKEIGEGLKSKLIKELGLNRF